MVFVVVLEPSGNAVKRSMSVWYRGDVDIVALHGFDESFPHAVAFGACNRREAVDEFEAGKGGYLP